jgi:hypothetical protein
MSGALQFYQVSAPSRLLYPRSQSASCQGIFLRVVYKVVYKEIDTISLVRSGTADTITASDTEILILEGNHE